MTTITFTFAATPLPDGRARVNMFIKQLEPTYTESPGEEWRAEKDAAQKRTTTPTGSCRAATFRPKPTR